MVECSFSVWYHNSSSMEELFLKWNIKIFWLNNDEKYSSMSFFLEILVAKSSVHKKIYMQLHMCMNNSR